MGYNTSLILLNDQAHTLRGDPNVGTAINEMVADLVSPRQHRRHPFGYNGLEAVHCSHADYDQIVRIGQNRGELVGMGYSLNPILDAAIALSKTDDPGERKRIIDIIERNARIHDRHRTTSNFTI